MFQLMNKDKVVATFDIGKTLGFDIIANLTVLDKLPLGSNEKNLINWVSGRYAAKHRSHLAGYLNSMQADDTRGFIKLTHSISINDTYWIKEDCENITWSDVSPYTNDFDEVIQHLAFDGGGLRGVQLSSTSPEFGTNGAYEKCWVREDNGIYLYKRGTVGFSNAGLEPYCEGLASKVFDYMGAGITYQIVNYRGKKASKCKLFTDERHGFVPYSLLCSQDSTLADVIKLYSEFDSDILNRMLVCDAITFNTDRHFGNFGFMYDTDSLELLGPALSFDYNLSLFPMEVNDAFVDVNLFIPKYVPKLGNDFVEVAKACLTSDIRSDLVNLKGFKHEYEGDDKFPKERVDWLTNLSNQQIDRILETTIVSMYTSPNTNNVSNIYKYRLRNKMTEEDFIKDVPRLMKLFDISHMSELEERIVELL